MKIRTCIILAAALAVLGVSPAPAGPRRADVTPDRAIRALEIELTIRVAPEKTLWYRIHIDEDGIPVKPTPAATAVVDGVDRESTRDASPLSHAGQIRNGITVVRAVRGAVVTLIKHWLATSPTPSERD